MKRNSLILLLLACSCMLAHGQLLVIVSGTIRDQNTGLPIPYQDTEIIMRDSSGTISYFHYLRESDSLGNYQHTVSSYLFPGPQHCEIRTKDCNGQYQSLHLVVPGNNTYFSGQDISICGPTGVCSSGFVASTPAVGTTLQFYDQSEMQNLRAVSWLWLFGDGGTSTLQNPAHTFPAPGKYEVCMQATSNTGCTSTFCDSVYAAGAIGGSRWAHLLYGEISPGQMGFTVIASSKPKPARYYIWAYSGYHSFSNSNVLPFEYPLQDTFTPCVNVLFSDSSWLTDCITIDPFATCQADYYITDDTTGQYSLLIVDNSFGNQLSYFWDFGDGSTSTSPYPQHTYAGAGTYTLCLTVTDSGSLCTKTYCEDISVFNKINAPFTIQVVQPLTTGITEITPQLPTVACYPNPAQDQVTVTFSLTTAANVALQILDLQGRVMRAMDANKYSAGMHEFSLSLGDLPAGLYLVRTVVGEQQVVKKLMLAR